MMRIIPEHQEGGEKLLELSSGDLSEAQSSLTIEEGLCSQSTKLSVNCELILQQSF